MFYDCQEVDDDVDGVRLVSELRPQTGLLIIPQVIYGNVNHGGMIPTGESSWYVHQSSPTALQAVM
jgi:hypothetical protein